MKVLREIGIEERLREVSFAPHSHLNRVWDTGEVTRELPMPESLYGAPYLCMHRADLHEALALGAAGRDHSFGKKLVGLDQAAGHVTLTFADGTRAQADAVIGADGVHSVVRDIIIGPDAPDSQRPHRLSRGISVRSDERQGHRLVPHQMVGHRSPHRHLLHDKARSEIYFVTSVPEPADWLTRESWSAKGDVKELRQAYEGFHPDVRAVLEACPDCHKWAILEREPLARWSQGRVVLLGDACHPMTPYMAQGARDGYRGRGRARPLPR